MVGRWSFFKSGASGGETPCADTGQKRAHGGEKFFNSVHFLDISRSRCSWRDHGDPIGILLASDSLR
jgi:hypothetical protein